MGSGICALAAGALEDASHKDRDSTLRTRNTGLPVFDWASFITYVYNAVVPHDYDGIC